MPALTQGVAAQNSASRQVTARCSAMGLDGGDGVARTSGLEPTVAAQVRAQQEPIGLHETNECALGPRARA
jgi:hypothetical protein